MDLDGMTAMLRRSALAGPGGSAPTRVRYFARAYEAAPDGCFTIARILEAGSEAESLDLAERLSATHIGAVAFALTSLGRPLLRGLGRFGETPD